MTKNYLAKYSNVFYITSLMTCSIKFETFVMVINQKIKSVVTYFLLVTILFKLSTLQAQVQNHSDIYIGDNSLFYTGANNFNFGEGSTTTSRTKIDYGVLSFSNGASWSGASDIHFLDGYGQTQSDEEFILPIGQSGIYAPIQVIPSTSGGVDAAYFRSAPNSIGGALDGSISSISSVEYWDINSKGVKTNISLSWRPSSAITDLTSSSLSNLTIVGWNGSVWVAIPSMIDEYSLLGKLSSLNSGSISTNEEVDLSAYSVFSLGTSTEEVLVTLSNKVEVIVYVNKNRVFIEASQPLKTLIVHDIAGKLIFSKKLDGGLTYNQPFNYDLGVYIVTTEVHNATWLFREKIISGRY
ncbi:hypothetical protein [Maribacter sp. ACAM166]|uniref:hypothetical protein n=1 Tax=Maribacter sp. ACAM166 TaxID=2508996 RepID=UPI0010FE8204|nr:hypothetical protein [Maribacter sp. ACAM166]TLP80295.1 hypothetical protein ES765_08905 [Maribacter sp. ACAM166]